VEVLEQKVFLYSCVYALWIEIYKQYAVTASSEGVAQIAGGGRCGILILPEYKDARMYSALTQRNADKQSVSK